MRQRKERKGNRREMEKVKKRKEGSGRDVKM